MKFIFGAQLLSLLACQTQALSLQSPSSSSTKNHAVVVAANSKAAASNVAAQKRSNLWASNFVAACLIVSTSASPVFADEYGVEKEAPTLYTGETVEICTKRGPLGACLRTEFRTEENDNDKAKQYFRDPGTILKERNEVLLGTTEDGEANSLIDRLKQQTEDNKEKNRLDVERKTFENDQSANFGPFDRQVIIMNTDGKTFTLLQNPQAMRLKKDGFITDRKFIKQPTEEELQQALKAEGEGIAGALSSIFSGGN
mmetsp:Transcript_295/g.398  ORF Transcript_295/g.398 Transcript_295/m.398 type:complete len:256 (-) Transcript_295:902-1669(-)|eukprot:CAMPEP_0198142652 /NCGR_PEP_ID=MMETSP1443-20131203/5389_1 /TAXON_ID=186043 /ORGANISM="Entomoneis sp., Strain CCMP2396" /LENGTH=255 /DNA_ID=CAMNT_0043805719 /DNA_START=112 /DNA_END=879 /DNA_ORIENTATION=+